jgi:hypothetical protein
MNPTQKAAMEQALEALERGLFKGELIAMREQAITALRAALAEPQQEPVAWGIPNIYGEIYDVISPDEHARCEGKYTVPLYTAPQPRREPLTDEEILEIKECYSNEFGLEDKYAKDFARAVIAAYRAKQGEKK